MPKTDNNDMIFKLFGLSIAALQALSLVVLMWVRTDIAHMQDAVGTNSQRLSRIEGQIYATGVVAPGLSKTKSHETQN